MHPGKLPVRRVLGWLYSTNPAIYISVLHPSRATRRPFAPVAIDCEIETLAQLSEIAPRVMSEPAAVGIVSPSMARTPRFSSQRVVRGAASSAGQIPAP